MHVSVTSLEYSFGPALHLNEAVYYMAFPPKYAVLWLSTFANARKESTTFESSPHCPRVTILVFIDK